MQKYFDWVKGSSGQVIPGASIAVYNAGTTVLATLYSDNGVTPLANPLTSGTADGFYSFFAANGSYDFVITKAGYTFLGNETTTIQLFDANAVTSTGSTLARSLSNRFADVVNVKDWAKGDGVTNDTAAFTSAGNGSGVVEVHVPSGTYLLSSNPTPTGDVTWVLHAGATTTGAGVLTGKIIKVGSTQSALSILNQKITGNIAGEAPGVKIGIASGTEAGWTSNPAVNNWVTLYPYVSSSAVRNKVWAANPIVDVISGSPATAWSIEADVNVGTANAPDPRNTNHALGIDVVSGGTFAPSAAFNTFSSTLANRWKHGLWFDSVGGQTGSTLIKVNANVSVDFGLDLSLATINFQGIRVGSTPAAQVSPIALRQFANNQVGLFLQRFTDAAPTGNLIQLTNAANSAVLMSLSAVGDINTAGIVAATGLVQGSVLQAAGAAPLATGVIGYGGTTAGTATAGAAALPANPVGFIVININGTTNKIPYYAN